MQGILFQIDGLESENDKMKQHLQDKDQIIKAYEKTNETISKESQKLKENSHLKNEQIARLDNENNQLKSII